MYLNTLQPAIGSKSIAKVLGRGIGSGLGKTCGKGHKGQKARAGGYHKLGFEGGQTPYKRRVAKFGFVSKKILEKAEIRLSELNRLFDNNKGSAIVINMDVLRANKYIKSAIKQVKIIATGEIKHALTITTNGALKVTKGAQQLIEGLGGKVLAENV
ncbi:MAG: 50S ribosomal protein L15 [Gammaproteobacteria bacterium]|jgi:large subunit ribosomal protein L15